MAKFRLTGGFQPIPEGVYVFRIDKVEYDEDFGKMSITLKTQTGRTHVETFRFLKGDGKTVNDGAMAAFSYFTRIAMNDMDLEELDDEQDLVGHFLKATVEHETSVSAQGKTYTNAKLIDKEPASGWDEEEEPMKVESDADDDPDDFLAGLLK